MLLRGGLIMKNTKSSSYILILLIALLTLVSGAYNFYRTTILSSIAFSNPILYFFLRHIAYGLINMILVMVHYYGISYCYKDTKYLEILSLLSIVLGIAVTIIYKNIMVFFWVDSLALLFGFTLIHLFLQRK